MHRFDHPEPGPRPLIVETTSRQVLSEADQDLLSRLELDTHVKDMVRQYWLDNPPEKKSKKFKRSSRRWYIITVAAPLILITGTLSPLFLNGATWAVNLSIFATWIMMMLVLLLVSVLTINNAVIASNEDANERKRLMKRGDIFWLTKRKKGLTWLLMFPALMALPLVMATQAHFITAIALVAFYVSVKFLHNINKGIITDALNKLTGIEIIQNP